jgi:flagellar hook protein FlgE
MDTSGVSPGAESADLSNAVTDLKISKIGYSASAKTIKVQDVMMGELLDIIR